MRLPELTVLYVLVGIGSAIAWLLSKNTGAGRIVDAFVLVALWPLYGPFLWLRTAPSSSRALLQADLRLLGGQAALARLDERILAAEIRIRDIDRLLAMPDFSEAVALARARDLRERGDPQAAEIAEGRAQNIRRLVSLRSRFARELDHVGELISQLRVQQELVRLGGGAADGAQDLLAELAGTVEGLDKILADDSWANLGMSALS